jgi:hypothetical protein
MLQRQITKHWPDIERAVTRDINEEGNALTDKVPVVTDRAEGLHIVVTPTRQTQPVAPTGTRAVTTFTADIDTFDIEHRYTLSADKLQTLTADTMAPITNWAATARRYETEAILQRLAANSLATRSYTAVDILDAEPAGFGERRLLVLVESKKVTDELEKHADWDGDIVRIAGPPKPSSPAALLFRTGGGPIIHRYSDLTLDWDTHSASGVQLILTERLRVDGLDKAIKFVNP